MHRSLSPGTHSIVICTAAIASLLLFYDFGKSDSRIVNTVVSFGHLPLFGVISLVIIRVLNQKHLITDRRKRYLSAWAATTFAGIVTECIQAFTSSRHFKVEDILTDALGAAVFLAFAYSFKEGTNKKAAAIMLTGVLLLMLIRAYPIFVVSIDTYNMERDFPNLSSFETPFEMSRWSNGSSDVERVRSHATDGQYSLMVNLLPGTYPGISLIHPAKDWRGHAGMRFDAYVEGTSGLDITVRVNDREHNEDYADRFNRRFRLQPGANSILVSLDEIRKAPAGRSMNMADIKNVCIFSYNLQEPRKVYFDNIRLVK